MASTLINEDVFLEQLLARINAELTEVAEPILIKHLEAAQAELEIEMRKRLGGLLVGFIEGRINMYRDDRQLVITLNQALPENRHG